MGTSELVVGYRIPSPKGETRNSPARGPWVELRKLTVTLPPEAEPPKRGPYKKRVSN